MFLSKSRITRGRLSYKHLKKKPQKEAGIFTGIHLIFAGKVKLNGSATEKNSAKMLVNNVLLRGHATNKPLISVDSQYIWATLSKYIYINILKLNCDSMSNLSFYA